jgi:hypothetical protein
MSKDLPGAEAASELRKLAHLKYPLRMESFEYSWILIPGSSFITHVCELRPHDPCGHGDDELEPGQRTVRMRTLEAPVLTMPPYGS